MKIKQVVIYKSRIRLNAPFITALGPHEFAESIFLTISCDNGLTGFGECSPFMTVNGENIETCFIVGQLLGKALKNKDPLDIEACHKIMDALIYGNTSIKSAFDIALYDLASQHAGVPLFQLLGGKNDKALITDYTVCLSDPDKMASDAEDILRKGFRLIKVKLGDAEHDVDRIKKIREAVGPEMPIRIDANQGWSKAEAIQVLKDLASYKIQYCEEPVARWNFMELAEIRANVPIPIMADESCCDHHDAKRLVDLKACDYFNLKLGKSSGIYKALKMIKVGESNGILMQVGGFLESRLGFTAAAHLALSSPAIHHCDFDTPLMFSDDPVAGGITYGVGGAINVPESAGLGAIIKPEYLSELPRTVVE